MHLKPKASAHIQLACQKLREAILALREGAYSTCLIYFLITDPCPDAYGMLLGTSPASHGRTKLNFRPHCVGTSLICSFLKMFLAFVLVRILRRIFPSMVTGTVVLLIGASLVGSSGIPNWGGGSNDCMGWPTSGFFELCPDIDVPTPLP